MLWVVSYHTMLIIKVVWDEKTIILKLSQNWECLKNALGGLISYNVNNKSCSEWKNRFFETESKLRMSKNCLGWAHITKC